MGRPRRLSIREEAKARVRLARRGRLDGIVRPIHAHQAVVNRYDPAGESSRMERAGRAAGNHNAPCSEMPVQAFDLSVEAYENIEYFRNFAGKRKRIFRSTGSSFSRPILTKLMQILSIGFVPTPVLIPSYCATICGR